MSGTGAGNGIGASGPPPALPPPAGAGTARPQWNDAIRSVMTGQVNVAAQPGPAMPQNDPLLAATVALDLAMPALLPPGLRPPGTLVEEMGAEGLEQHPAGLTDPTRSTGGMAPVDPAAAEQTLGQADLSAPLAPSAGVPSHLIPVLRAAGYHSGSSAPPPDGPETAVVSPRAGPGSLPAAAAAGPAAAPAAHPRIASAPGVTGSARSAIGTGASALRAEARVATPTPLPPLAGAPATALPVPVHVTVDMPDSAPANAAQAAVGTAAATGTIAATGTYPANPYQPIVAVLASPYGALLPRPASLARNPDGWAWSDAPIVSYSERRPVPIDLAPAPVAVASWRLDDTQALATVGPGGLAAATDRARQLYRALQDDRSGLATLQLGEGFVTWDGSPLWLSLAGIGKPAALGVLLAPSGRIQVMRAEAGDWLVEHAGGPWPTAHAARHAAQAGDDEALLLDVLYGIASRAPAVPPHFEAALAAMRFAAAPTAAAWRTQEAWALVARCCAVAVAQPDVEACPERQALHAALAAVVERAAPVPRAVPLTREHCIAVALSGDPAELAAALSGLGHATLARTCEGNIDDVGLLEALGLAIYLGRLTSGVVQQSHPPIRRFALVGNQVSPSPQGERTRARLPWRSP